MFNIQTPLTLSSWLFHSQGQESEKKEQKTYINGHETPVKMHSVNFCDVVMLFDGGDFTF